MCMKYLRSVYCVITSNARWVCRLCHLQSGKPECHEHCACGMRNNIIDPATIVFFYFFRPLRLTLSYFWRHSSCFAFARGQCWGARNKASLDAVSRKQGLALAVESHHLLWNPRWFFIFLQEFQNIARSYNVSGNLTWRCSFHLVSLRSRYLPQYPTGPATCDGTQ